MDPIALKSMFNIVNYLLVNEYISFAEECADYNGLNLDISDEEQFTQAIENEDILHIYKDAFAVREALLALK